MTNAESQDVGSRGQPRIVELLIWTVGFAFTLALYRRLHPGLGYYRGVTGIQARLRDFANFYDVGMAAAFATFLAGAEARSLMRRAGRPWVERPGHVLLILGLAASAADVVAMLVYEATRSPNSLPGETAYWALFGNSWAPNLPAIYGQLAGWSLGALAAAACGLIWRRRLGRTWLAVLCVFAAGSAFLVGGHALFLIRDNLLHDRPGIIAWNNWTEHIYGAFVAVSLAALIAAACVDALAPRRGDRAHRAGVIAWLLVGLVQLAAYGKFAWNL